MKVLVTVSSKHGATAQIGDAIGDTLREEGIEVVVAPPEQVVTLDGFDAVIAGSALYMGRWLGPARDFIRQNADRLRTMPVWLFASGPITAVDDQADAAEGKRLQELIGARDMRVFAGDLEKERLSFFERQIVKMVKSPWGDYRPWAKIVDWTEDIAKALEPVAAG